MKLITLFSAILLAHQCLAQERFIVNIVQFTPATNATSFRCVGTIINQNHVLAPASCVTIQSQFSVGVEVGLGVNRTFVPAQKVFIHPEFQGEARSNNVAIVRVEQAFNSSVFQPRTLGALPTNETCHLFGGAQENARQDAINVYSPEFCDGDNFPQVFCTSFDSKSDPACTASFGSPLTCSDHSAIAGFLISNDETCSIHGNGFALNYHSVGGFQEWIDEISAAESYSKMSIYLISFSAMLISFRNML